MVYLNRFLQFLDELNPADYEKEETQMEENKAGCSERCVWLMDRVMDICMFVLVFIFPLIFNDAYYDIPEVKYQCYYLSILVSLVLILILAAVMLVSDRVKNHGERTKRFFDGLRPSNWKKTFRAADFAVLAFWLSVLISTLQSDYFYESVWGNEGRFSGLFLITVYVVAYFLISRLWTFKPWVMQVFLVSGMIMCLIGVGDYFQLDPLRLRGGTKPAQSEIFTSTIGNINIYTAYVALIMGFSAAMFTAEKNRIKKLWYYGCLIVSFFAIVMGCSDNAYLALAALFGLGPFILFRDYDGIKKYLILLASFFTVIQCIMWLNDKYWYMVIGLDSLFQVLAAFEGLLPLVIALWILALGSAAAGRFLKFDKNKFARGCLIAWGVFVAVCILVVIFALYDANIVGHADRYSALGNYLIFNDSWGTDRGYIWKASMRLYRDFPLIRKLFGYGPETFGILTITKIHDEMVAATGLIYDNAHNEYLQYLITLGAVGLITYLSFLFLVFRNMYRRRTESSYMLGLLCAVVCYCAQAVVNLNLPMVAPTMWMMLSIGMTTHLKRKDKRQKEQMEEKSGVKKWFKWKKG